jgi:hypothetical protein
MQYRLLPNLDTVPSAIGVFLTLWMAVAIAAEDAPYKTAGGITAYIGFMPAELVKGPGPRSTEKRMHGQAPRGRHKFHLVVAIFDADSGARVTDATVSARISGLGLSGVQKALEPMKIADTITYGAFFNLTPDIYTIRLAVQRPGAPPATLDFKYDHSP